MTDPIETPRSATLGDFQKREYRIAYYGSTEDNPRIRQLYEHLGTDRRTAHAVQESGRCDVQVRDLPNGKWRWLVDEIKEQLELYE